MKYLLTIFTDERKSIFWCSLYFFFGFDLFMDIYESFWNTFLPQEESEKKGRRNSRRGKVHLKSRETSVQPFHGRHAKMWLLTHPDQVEESITPTWENTGKEELPLSEGNVCCLESLKLVHMEVILRGCGERLEKSAQSSMGCGRRPMHVPGVVACGFLYHSLSNVTEWHPHYLSVHYSTQTCRIQNHNHILSSETQPLNYNKAEILQIDLTVSMCCIH